MTHRVYFNRTGQSLTTIPHREGSPVVVASATYSLLDTRYTVDSTEHVVVAAGTAATVDATSTTLSAAAGRNANDKRALTLASTAGVVAGHFYALTSTTGDVELVRVAAVVSGTVLRTATAMRGIFAALSTFKGIEVSASFPDALAADDENLEQEPWVVVWTIAGFPPLRESIYLERGEESQLATLDALARLDPTIPLAGGDRVDPTAALAQAHTDLRIDLQLAGISESDLLTGPIGEQAVTARAAFLLFQHGDDPVSERKAKNYEARYQQLLAGLTIGSLKPQVLPLNKSDENAEAISPAKLWYGVGFTPGGW